MKYLLPAVAFCIASGQAIAGNSYVLPDGVSRAPAVTLHCATGPGTAVACGTTAQPVVVSQPVGSATSANQSTEISVQQGMAQSLGTPADPIYGGGSGSMVSILKGVSAALTAGVQAIPVGGQPISRSLPAVPAMTSSAMFPANPSRHYLAFQAPQGNYIWVNFLGGIAGPNLPDCVYFSAGALYESGSYVDRGAISVYSPISTTISAWEG